MDLLIIIQALWIVIPIYVANASAVIVGGGTPIDFGKNWRDGRRILGDGKTWRGLFSGTFLGMTAGFGLTVAASYLSTSEYAFLGLTNFEGFPFMIVILFSLCFGALLGDVVESFFKRRIGKDRGQESHDCLIGERRFRSVSESVVVQGQRASGLRFGDRRVLALMQALCLFSLESSGFRHRQLRERVTQLLGVGPDAYGPGPMTHDLRRLRLHGLIQRIPSTHRYRMTDSGAVAAQFYVRFYARALRPSLSLEVDRLHGQARTSLTQLQHAVGKLLQEVHLAA